MKIHSSFFCCSLLLSSVSLFITSAALQAANEVLDKGAKNTQPLNYSPPQVNVKVKFVEMPDEVATKLLIGFAANNPGLPNSPTVITDPQARITFRGLETNHEVNILNMLDVTTLSGRQAQIQMTKSQAIAIGIKPEALSPPGITATNDDISAAMLFTNMLTGPSVDLIPYVSADGFTIQLGVTPSFSEFLGYDDPGPAMNIFPTYVYLNGKVLSASLPLPHFRLRKVDTSAAIWDGQTLVLGGLVSQQTVNTADKYSTTNKKRQLLIFITPTLIDRAGNRIHTDEEVLAAQKRLGVQSK